jgi:hypothetical protein
MSKGVEKIPAAETLRQASHHQGLSDRADLPPRNPENASDMGNLRSTVWLKASRVEEYGQQIVPFWILKSISVFLLFLVPLPRSTRPDPQQSF